jgi:outer membrane translocation and assembly module TamA
VYVPLSRRLVIAARATAGRFLLGEGDAETPVTRRYYGGGASGHRGFGYRRLSPMLRGEEGLIPMGGVEMLESSIEARWAAFVWRGSWVSFVTFLDAGDVTHRNELELDDLHLAAGVGARYDTVIGPIRFDVGFRLNRWEAAGIEGLDNPDPGTSTWDRFAIHFSLGEAF